MANDSYLHIDFKQSSHAVFDRKMMRRAFSAIGQQHMVKARQLISSRDGSAAGQNPGTRTGLLARSIGYYVPNASSRRPGFMVRISPNQKRGKGRSASIIGAYYPAFLLYGVRNGSKRKKSHHKGASGGNGWRIAPRKNFMVAALDNLTPWTRYVLAQALRRSLKTQKG